MLWQVVATLEAKKGASEAKQAARTLLRHYLGKAKRLESLTGPETVLREPGKPVRRGRSRQRLMKQHGPGT